MKLNWGILFAFLGSSAWASLPVQDEDFGCIDKTKAEAYVQAFQIDLGSFGGLELCNPEVDTKKLFNDLQMVEEGRFGGNKQNLFIKNTIPADSYFAWAKEQTRGVRRGHDIPYATAYNSWGYFTMQDGWTKLSSLGRVGTFLHEARHTEGYTHVPCTQGPYKGAGLAGCDETLAEGGSHGLEMEYYSRVVLQGQNFHPVYQQMARLMNLGRANFVFNDNPMKQTEHLVAQLSNSLVQVTPQEDSHEISVSGLGDFDLKRTSFGVTLYKNQTAYAIDLYSPQATPVRDEYSYYKLLIDGRLSGVVQIEEVDLSNRRYLVALTSNGQLYTYLYPQGKWSAPTPASDVSRLVTTSPSGTEGLFVVNRQGQVLPLNPQNLRSGTTVGQWPEGTIQFVNWQDGLLKLDGAGHVTETNSGKAYMPLQSKTVHQVVRAPAYDAFAFGDEVR